MSDQLSQEQIGSYLRRAAQVEPRRDLATEAWQTAAQRRRRSRWGAAGAVLAAASLATVLVWAGPFTGAPSTPVPAPAGTGQDTPGGATFVFQPAGDSDWQDYSEGGATPPPPGAAVPELLDNRWELDGLLLGSAVAWPEESSYPDQLSRTELQFNAGQDGEDLTLEVSVGSCGVVATFEDIDVHPDGQLQASAAPTNRSCSSLDPQALDYWSAHLPGATLHLQDSVLYLTVTADMEEGTDRTNPPSPEDAGLGSERPTSADLDTVAALTTLAQQPTAAAAQALPTTGEVQLGLGSQLVTTVPGDLRDSAA